MKNEQYVTEYRNKLGESSWQPTLPTGHTLHWGLNRDFKIWSSLAEGYNVLYRSRARAVRVAKREERRRLKHTWKKAE